MSTRNLALQLAFDGASEYGGGHAVVVGLACILNCKTTDAGSFTVSYGPERKQTLSATIGGRTWNLDVDMDGAENGVPALLASVADFIQRISDDMSGPEEIVS